MLTGSLDALPNFSKFRSYLYGKILSATIDLNYSAPEKKVHTITQFELSG